MSMDVNSRVTLKRIGKQLGISVTTVSRILNGHARRYRISKETEKSVVKLAAELKFVPSRLARGLRLNKTTTIGLVIPDISNPFFASIANGVTVEAHRNNYGVILCDSQDNVDMEIESLEVLFSRGIEGLLLCPVGQSCEHLKKFERSRFPIVLADRYFPQITIPYVASDNFAGARDATQYLIENGHRQIMCLQGLRNTSPNKDRVRGYEAALAAHSIPVNRDIMVGNSFNEQCGYSETRQLLENKQNFTAILAFSNLLMLGALRALSEAKLRIPDNLSMISFDDQPYMAHLSPPMTTIAQESSEIGQKAVRLLLERIQSPDKSTPEGVLLPTRLIVRESVKHLN
ncbi:MAG: LacI family DNA-binding transcriptional regulator [Kiritimatiellae bacterium]|nr:LacI family DNA-binding transcriptional regulator [Kiritimatiellia bacterium]MDD5519235.1 LacI family DNA-binding transcriptional regulator [Kiritimatiellia bacterium]